MTSTAIPPENQHPVIIVGGGPGGLATALHLAREAPDLAEKLLILEARHHPRPKLCGGGVTTHGEEQLQALGIEIDAPAFVVHNIQFRLGKQSVTIEHENAMRVFDRAEFDAALARLVVQNQLDLRSGERLLELRPVRDGYELTTDQARYFARVVIAADGANSTVRRKLKLNGTTGIARLLRIMTPVTPEESDLWRQHTAVFDFSCVQQHLQGYVWDFPALVNNKPFMNRGIFDSRIEPDRLSERKHARLKSIFAGALHEREIDLNQHQLEGHPVRWFDPNATFSMPHVLLVGDAAGVDPLFAEGISYAMEYGAIAAQHIKQAFASDDFRFEGYRAHLLAHRLGKLLARRTYAARHLYRYRYPPLWSALWFFAGIAPKTVQRKVGAALALLPATR